MDLQEVKVSSKEIRRCIKQIIDNINECVLYAVPVKMQVYGIKKLLLDEVDAYTKKNMIDWLHSELDEETAILRLRRRIEYSKHAIKLDIH